MLVPTVLLLRKADNQNEYYNSKQTRIPVLIAEKLDICDPVLVFDGIMEEIAIWEPLKTPKIEKCCFEKA